MTSAQSVATIDPDTDAQVFDRVFKKRPGTQRVPVVLVIDGVPGSTILIELARATVNAPTAAILAAITPKLSADAARTVAATLHEPRVTIAALRAAGFGAEYDPHKLELQIAVPARLTKQQSHDVGGRPPPEAAGALRPSDVSGYVNLRAGAGRHWQSGDATASQPPLYLNTSSVLNLDGWVLEARGDISRLANDGTTVVGHRGDVLLSHDVEASALRYLAGDFAVPLAGFQPGFPVLGIGVVRSFGIQPYRVVQPVGSFDFVLDKQSTVTVLVNGAPIQTLSLPAGRHDIRDLPLAAGVNDIELVIKDAAGIERRVAFSAASPNQLLAPGVVQFSVTAGFPLLEDVGLRTYDFTRPILSGRRRWGVTQWLTAGGSFDSSPNRQRAGAELAVATTLGNLAFETAGSCDFDAGCGHAESLRYDYARGAPGSATAIAVIGQHLSPGYHDITLGVVEHYSDRVTVLTSHAITKRLAGRLDLKYQLGRDRPDAREASLGFSRSFGGLGLTTLVSVRDDGIAAPEARVFVTAQWVLAARRGAVFATSRSSTNSGTSNEVTYATRAGPPPGGLASSVTVRQSPSDAGAAGALGYTGDRFTSTASAATLVDGDGRIVQTSAIEASTALAFAGGRTAWSRPITGSFAMIERHHALDGIPLEVDPALGGRAAATDSFGLAVVPSVEAYRVGRITVAAPTLPLGASLGPASYVLLPTYKSGTLVRVGEVGTVFLRGTLVHPGGEPHAFVVGEVLSLDHRDRPAIPLLTNRAGRFSLMGLTPGRYTLRLSGATTEIAIPVGFTGMYSAGVVTVEHE